MFAPPTDRRRRCSLRQSGLHAGLGCRRSCCHGLAAVVKSVVRRYQNTGDGVRLAPPIDRRRPSAPRPPAWPIALGSTHARDAAHESARRSRRARWPRSMAHDGPPASPVAHSTTAETPWLRLAQPPVSRRAIRHARSVRGSTTSHHAIGAGRWEARGWGWPYFSQPICAADRSLFSPTPSPLVPRQRAQSANSLGKWRARQDSNLRPSA